MQVALTGSSGFTGRFVADALTAAGATCIPLSVDLRDAAAVDKAVEETPFDRLIHLAAIAFIDSDDWHAFYSVNQLGTFNLLDAIARTRPGTRCVLASSAQVYGPGAKGLVAEDAVPAPSNHYAVSKWMMELGAQLWRDRLDIVITRPFNYTGVGQETQYLIPKIIDHFRREANLIELGNTWVQRDFGDVRSVAEAYAGLVLTDKTPELVNIGTGIVSSIDDILAMLIEITGHSLEVRTNPALMRVNDVPVLGGDATLLRENLPHWQPYSLAATLQWMYEHSVA
ncbi:GDP-mannose 4,6-dehydratase (plasmid) [Sphingomonadaceae bacterium OTU29LAMAA1]|nr:GDP-mannose 4,6-dehydratase [Sphingomonadaceae bacterium OTU29LAMAA1]